MKKRTWIIVLAVIVAVAACVGIYFAVRGSGQPQPPDQPGPGTVEPQPGQNDKPGKTVSVVVYVPDEQSEVLTPVGAEAADDSDQALVDALVSVGGLPEDCEALGSETVKEGGATTLKLDMNAVYGNAVRSSGTAGETMLVYALVNSFIQARGVDNVLLTVEGEALQSGHEVYDYPLEMDHTS